MRLALRNLLHDRLRFLVTVIGITFATFLMIFQGSLLAGFIRAASIVIDSTDADIWIMARGVPSFDFSVPLPRRFGDLAMGVDGVANVQRVVLGHGVWKKSSGMHQTVALVGAETGVGGKFPFDYLNQKAKTLQPDAVLIDASTANLFEAETLPQDIEINQRRAHLAKMVEGFGTFHGNPYVFTAYRDALKYLQMDEAETRFLLVRVAPEKNRLLVKAALQKTLPEADVHTAEEFSFSARKYWILKTGAGGALLTTALLAFVVGLVIVSQNIYATTMENIEEFATLKAIGASRWFVRKVVLIQALTGGVIGSLLGLLITNPLVSLTRNFISWVYTPWWLPFGMIVVSLTMCALAAIVAINKAVAVEPARVFRA